MSITLQDFASGDTNYVAKLNSNSDVIEAAIAALQSLTSGVAFAANSIADAYGALFGSAVALIGDDSYVCSDAGSSNLNVTSGYCYRPDLTSVLYKGTSTTLSFTGQPADTYYVIVDSTGAPTRDTSSTEAIYSVVWSGAAFGAITRLATVVWGAADWIAAQTSTGLSTTFTSLDDRLEAIETAIGAAVTAQAPHTFYAGPTGGSPTNSAPTFRAIAASDLPTFIGDSGGSPSNSVQGAVPVATSGDAAAAKYLKADGTWGVPAGSGGAVFVGDDSGSPNSSVTGSVPVANQGDAANGKFLAADGTWKVSYLPQNSKSAAYTTVLADSGKHLLHPSADTTARTFTIDSNANVAYPLGTAITFVNQASAGVMTISITSDTMRLAGAGTTGSRTLAANGIATALKVTSTEWIISGTGLT